MAGNYCPIFDLYDGRLHSIGLWALDTLSLDKSISAFMKSGAIDLNIRQDLSDLAQPTLEFLTKAQTRRVPNTAVDVGNGVRFENGVFIMLIPYEAPNEELSKRGCETKYSLQKQDGVVMLKRSGSRPKGFA